MLLNHTDVAVDEELEKVNTTIYSSTETDIGDNESGYEYPFGKSTETSSETEVCLQLGYILKFNCSYIVLNEIR